MGIQYNKWELISTWKKFGERSSLTFSDLCSESEPGNTDSLESSIRPQDHPAQTRPASLATRESKVSSSTEFASVEVAVNDQSRRELFMVSQETPVARARSRSPEPTNLLLRNVLDVNAATFVFLTLTGLVRMLATNSTKSSLSIHPTKPSDVTHASTGLSHQSTPAERRGLTATGRKSRGMLQRGHKANKLRPSIRGSWKKRNTQKFWRYRAH